MHVASLEGAVMILPRVGAIEVTIERETTSTDSVCRRRRLSFYGHLKLTRMAAQYENGPRDRLRLGKPSRYVTSHHDQLSLAINP